ncbi:hypothetical protein MVEN_01374800 [Mycena venus]|uniref:Ubiquitin 3 binding protein But2 C-terminal domain-containing protein n=1 Tax=Mycena venus TaxID=2733690 RepID=A0A8H6XWR9_9AGAR|nr:hypothetical protein MVEN_01374800 [Mycena venus]
MSRAQYSSLPQEDQDHNKSLQDDSSSNSGLHKLVYWSIVVISVCSVIDVFALIYFASRTVFQAPVSLDDIPIVDSSHPSRVFAQWSETWATPHGIVPINDRRLLVTEMASTVAQFRILDFGMEHCVITLAVPFQNLTAPTARFDLQQQSLDVWLLKANGKLNFQELSWKTKPNRDHLLGHFSTTSGTTQELAGFPCVSGTYLTIELACQIPGCFFESVATQKNAIGVYLKQHQTI